ncbi:glycosyltransferase family 4 protein [Sphingomonas daechungensis]|uniref:glycosyltransferase family 4 protein n=1 Tax=Sphingomonas daechungensis TaxID=1176646 RepID=UPI003782FFBF
MNYYSPNPMSPLRVAIVTTFYPPCNFGGDGIYIRNFVQSLARRGCEVEVIYDADAWKVGVSALHPPPSPEPVPQPDGVTVHQLESRWPLGSTLLTQQAGRPVVQHKAIQAILAKGFDVIHFHNISLVGGPAVLALGEAIKLCTVHDHWLVCPNHILWRHDRELCVGRECFKCSLTFRRPPQAWRHTSLLEDNLAHLDALIALSQSVADRHREFGLKKDMLPMASFMPNADAQASSTALGSSHDRPYFLFVGRLQSFKGVQDAISCFDDDSPADLLIAGSGEFEPELRALAAGRKSVKFLGKIEQDKLRALYRDAVALIAPSLCYEVFPMVALEAFREGTPVIARNLGPYRQIVEESAGGILFDDEHGLRDAMTKLASDPALRDRLGASGRAALAERWTETKAIDDWLELVRSIAVKKGKEDTKRKIDALFAIESAS